VTNSQFKKQNKVKDHRGSQRVNWDSNTDANDLGIYRD